MTGTVRWALPRKGRVAVETESGAFSVLETLGGLAVLPGQQLEGELESYGPRSLRHLDSGESIDVYIESVGLSTTDAKRSCFLGSAPLAPGAPE